MSLDGMILRDANGNPFSTTTAADGSFVFMCVQHGFVQAKYRDMLSTAADRVRKTQGVREIGG